jgi:uridine kinase
MKPFVLGVAGGTGSGKTTLVRRLIEKLGADQIAVVEHDSYYLSNDTLTEAEREQINYDHPDALETSLLVDHLDQLKSNRPVEVPVYDFATHRRRVETRRVDPRRLIIVEGILALSDSALRDRMNLKVFVDAGDDVRLNRRLKRDQKERGRSVDSVMRQYLETVKPMHEDFVRPSSEYADLVVSGENDIESAVNALAVTLRSLLATDQETDRR